MSRLDELPPDQRAALSLLLRQRKSYAEVASLLGIAERAVHDRAHAALAVLAPRQARELTPERRLEIGDYLLGQQPGVAERLKTRTYLSGSEPARGWADEIAAAARPAGGRWPAGDPSWSRQRGGLQRVGDLSSSASSAAAGARDAGAGGMAAAQPARSLPSSRVGGAVLLAVIVAAVIVAVVLLTGGGSHAKKSATAAASTTSSTATAATKTGPTVENQIALNHRTPGAGASAWSTSSPKAASARSSSKPRTSLRPRASTTRSGCTTRPPAPCRSARAPPSARPTAWPAVRCSPATPANSTRYC